MSPLIAFTIITTYTFLAIFQYPISFFFGFLFYLYPNANLLTRFLVPRKSVAMPQLPTVVTVSPNFGYKNIGGLVVVQ